MAPCQLPPVAWQEISDWIPTFQGRAALRALCRTVVGVEWRLAPLSVLPEDLGGLDLGDLGARAAAQTLLRRPPTKFRGMEVPRVSAIETNRLNLSGNNIGDRGAEALAAALVASPPRKLARLLLHGNSIGDRGGRALLAALAPHAPLKELDLCDNRMSETCKQEFRASRPGGTAWVLLGLPAPSPSYMETVQTDLNERMRTIVLDWLDDAFFLNDALSSLGPRVRERVWAGNAFFHTCYYIDRFLSIEPVSKTKLQLLGVASVLAASGPWTDMDSDPEMERFVAFLVHMTNLAYTGDEVRAQAQRLVDVVGLAQEQHTTHSLRKRYFCATGFSLEDGSLTLSELLARLTSLEYGFLCFSPEARAAASIFLTCRTLGSGAAVRGWQRVLYRCVPPDLRHELEPCAVLLAEHHSKLVAGQSQLYGHRGVGELSFHRRFDSEGATGVKKMQPPDADLRPGFWLAEVGDVCTTSAAAAQGGA